MSNVSTAGTSPRPSVPPPSPSAARVPSQTLRRGASGEDVRWVQRRLGLEADGVFGPQTEAAVRRFQEQQGLSADGVVGPLTRARLAGGDTFEPPAPRPSVPPVTPPPSNAVDRAPQGQSRSVKGFKEISEARLRDALPSQAKHLAPAFIQAARQNDLDPLVLVAISKLETGNFTSSAFHDKNNAMGISGSGGPKRFSSHAESIQVMARTLSRPDGYYRNARTIAQVGRIYSPPGASNDVNGTNGGWPRNVAAYADALWAKVG